MPCDSLRRIGGAAGGAAPFISTAIAELSKASGLAFVYDGTTSEQPSSAQRTAYQRSRYGNRWAPLLIAWTTPTQQADLAGDIIGLGGPVGLTPPDGRTTYVTGAVALDAPQMAQALRRGPQVAAVMQAVVLHEIGHALGLAHVNDPTEITYPEAQIQATGLGDGDRRGLAALGSGRCESHF